MHQTIHGFTYHFDATRFEVEDVLVRQAAASLLSEATQIDAIIIDVSMVVRSAPSSGAGDLGSIGALMAISSSNNADTVPESLADLVAEAAVLNGCWAGSTTEIIELSKPWVGQATPGPKVTAFLKRSGADSPEYRSDVEEIAREVAENLGDAGSRVTHTDDPACPFEVAISYWFASPQAAKVAFEANSFDRLKTSTLFDQDSAVLIESIEHRVQPNPNTWVTTTGVQPPTEPG